MNGTFDATWITQYNTTRRRGGNTFKSVHHRDGVQAALASWTAQRHARGEIYAAFIYRCTCFSGSHMFLPTPTPLYSSARQGAVLFNSHISRKHGRKHGFKDSVEISSWYVCCQLSSQYRAIPPCTKHRTTALQQGNLC